jgi:hypothetical protein
MAVTGTWYTKGDGAVGSKAINLGSDTLKVALLTSAYTPARDSDDFWGTISGNEVSGPGYTAGGATLAGQSWAIDAANHRYKLTGTNVTWTSSTITARFAVLYHSTGVAGTSELIAYFDFGANVVSSGGTFQITWDGTNGILTATCS